MARRIKKCTCSAGDRHIDSNPGLGRSPGRAQSTRVFLPGESPGTEEPRWLQSKESQKFSGLSIQYTGTAASRQVIIISYYKLLLQVIIIITRRQ